ncbi:hypothetical protein ANO11243_009810 [Dothideomycetidae sp. 11243]|nr:hypothetical protein ANO11243_009810 [fungal sp. No.11243]
MVHHDSEIIIVGAGAFGTSTAYHLARRGFQSVRVFDPYPPPSCEAAATDISKVIRSDYAYPLYARLGLESIEAWQSWDMFQGLYHKPGWMLSAFDLSVPFVERSVKVSKSVGDHGIEVVTTDDIKRRVPQISGRLDGWNFNVWNPNAGWANADKALEKMALAAQAAGVEYISGEAGHVDKIMYRSGRCRGVVTRDGMMHEAELVVLAAGAWSPSLVDLEDQLVAKGHAVAHIQLSPEETQFYADMPIMDSLELGYFFPPQENGIFKMAHSQFITNTQKVPQLGISTSVPHTFVMAPSDDLPVDVESTMRRNLARVFPELSQRPFCFTRLCWDADTADRHFLIAPHPKTSGLFLACAGSAHGFKFLPVLGKYIVDAIEGKLDPATMQSWRWRAGEKFEAKSLAHMDPELELWGLSGWKNRRTNRLSEAEIRSHL